MSNSACRDEVSCACAADPAESALVEPSNTARAIFLIRICPPPCSAAEKCGCYRGIRRCFSFPVRAVRRQPDVFEDQICQGVRHALDAESLLEQPQEARH